MKSARRIEAVPFPPLEEKHKGGGGDNHNSSLIRMSPLQREREKDRNATTFGNIGLQKKSAAAHCSATRSDYFSIDRDITRWGRKLGLYSPKYFPGGDQKNLTKGQGERLKHKFKV